MSVLLPRFYRHQQEAAQRAVDRAVEESVDTTPVTVARATLPGDNRRLRGIPVCTFGVQGTAPGTDPLAEAIRKL
jgi:hypothetical protein